MNSNWSYSPETLNSGQNQQLFGKVTSKFDGWPWKTIGHLFYTISSIVHHFKAIIEFKLELRSGNSQFGSKSAVFCPVWPWNLTDDLEKQEALWQCKPPPPLDWGAWNSLFRCETVYPFATCVDIQKIPLISTHPSLHNVSYTHSTNKANLRDLKAATGL